MPRLFDISTTTDALNLDPGGRGKLLFTVTNTTQRPQRGSLRVRALDSGQASWLALAGDAERDFPPGFTHQVELAVAVPPGTPAGKFRVRLDALSVANPDDDFTEGQAVGVTIPAAAAPVKPKSMWWVWLIAGIVVLVVAGAVAFVLLHKPKPGGGGGEPPSPPGPSGSQPQPQPVTREFNDPRIQVPEGALPLDVCREWGTNCGKPAADAFCRTNGMNAAADFRIAINSPPTVIVTSKQVCRDQSCDRITWVKCAGTGGTIPIDPNIRLRVNAETLRNLQQLQLRGKQVQLPE